MGAPLKETKKDESISFRVTQADKLYYVSLAKKLGMTVSDLIYRRLENLPIINMEFERYKWETIKELSREINYIGNNINQITKELHLIQKGALIPSTQFTQLQQALKDYETNRNLLIDAISKATLKS